MAGPAIAAVPYGVDALIKALAATGLGAYGASQLDELLSNIGGDFFTGSTETTLQDLLNQGYELGTTGMGAAPGVTAIESLARPIAMPTVKYPEIGKGFTEKGSPEDWDITKPVFGEGDVPINLPKHLPWKEPPATVKPKTEKEFEDVPFEEKTLDEAKTIIEALLRNLPGGTPDPEDEGPRDKLSKTIKKMKKKLRETKEWGEEAFSKEGLKKAVKGALYPARHPIKTITGYPKTSILAGLGGGLGAYYLGQDEEEISWYDLAMPTAATDTSSTESETINVDLNEVNGYENGKIDSVDVPDVEIETIEYKAPTSVLPEFDEGMLNLLNSFRKRGREEMTMGGKTFNILDEIYSQGLTREQLDSLGVPIPEGYYKGGRVKNYQKGGYVTPQRYQAGGNVGQDLPGVLPTNMYDYNQDGVVDLFDLNAMNEEMGGLWDEFLGYGEGFMDWNQDYSPYGMPSMEQAFWNWFGPQQDIWTEQMASGNQWSGAGTALGSEWGMGQGLGMEDFMYNSMFGFNPFNYGPMMGNFVSPTNNDTIYSSSTSPYYSSQSPYQGDDQIWAPRFDLTGAMYFPYLGEGQDWWQQGFNVEPPSEALHAEWTDESLYNYMAQFFTNPEIMPEQYGDWWNQWNSLNQLLYGAQEEIGEGLGGYNPWEAETYGVPWQLWDTALYPPELPSTTTVPAIGVPKEMQKYPSPGQPGYGFEQWPPESTPDVPVDYSYGEGPTGQTQIDPYAPGGGGVLPEPPLWKAWDWEDIEPPGFQGGGEVEGFSYNPFNPATPVGGEGQYLNPPELGELTPDYIDPYGPSGGGVLPEPPSYGFQQWPGKQNPFPQPPEDLEPPGILPGPGPNPGPWTPGPTPVQGVKNLNSMGGPGWWVEPPPEEMTPVGEGETEGSVYYDPFTGPQWGGEGEPPEPPTVDPVYWGNEGVQAFGKGSKKPFGMRGGGYVPLRGLLK